MDYLEAAKARIAEIEGEHPAWQVDSLVRVAIADALVAIAEAARHALKLVPERTCHDEGDPSDFCCSECGVRMFTNTSDTYTMIASDERTIIKRPNYCPWCGAKVVSE